MSLLFLMSAKLPCPPPPFGIMFFSIIWDIGFSNAKQLFIKRADEARKQSLEILERLASIKSERLRLTFHTSSANFTSVEALQFLDGFNTLDEVTLMERMTFKHTISHDIEAFSEAEEEFNKKALEKKRMDLQVKAKGIEFDRAVRNLKEAELVSCCF